MQYALINGLRRTAEPKLNAICGHCNSSVRAKCGSKVVWHWAHIAAETCDSWYEPETQWHRDWKNYFGEAFSEISIVKDGVRHIADVLTMDDLVIEFQNSTISSETIVARETFYDKMIWVINGAHFKENFSVWDKEFIENWRLPFQEIQNSKFTRSQPNARLLVVQGCEIKQEAIREILIRNKFIHDEYRDMYSYDLKNMYNSFALVAKILGSILELYRAQKTDKKLKPVVYTWTRPRKSWLDAKKPVFIDLNDDYLIWIKTNIGNKEGDGIKVSKKDFLAKYRSID